MLAIFRKVYHSAISDEIRHLIYKYRHFRAYQEQRSMVFPSPKGDFSLKPFDEHQAIFVHITKTAGTSVAKSLFDYLPYHYTALEYRVIYGRKTFNNYFKFAFVRNPWDRVYSAYRYLKSGGWNDEDKAWANEHLDSYSDFNQFVINWLTPTNIKKHVHFKPQYEFICDTKGRLIIDYIAYFETLNEDYKRIASKLNNTSDLKSHNMNPGANYTKVYSEETKSIVNEVYKTDIDMFGYEFERIKQRTTINKI